MKKFLLVILLIVFGSELYAQKATNENVTALYIATFDRAPDAEGLNYWVNISELTLEEIALSFFDQEETQEKYPSDYTNYEFVYAIYQNLFGRDPDEDGILYWDSELDENRIDRSFFILAVVNGAKGDDSLILENKTKVGMEFVESNVDDMEMARDIVSDITSNPSSVEVALGKLDINHQNPIDSHNNKNELGERVIFAYISSVTINPIDGGEADVIFNADSAYSNMGNIVKYIWRDINGNILSTDSSIEFPAEGNPLLAGDTVLPDCKGYLSLTIYDNNGYSDTMDTMLNGLSDLCH